MVIVMEQSALSARRRGFITARAGFTPVRAES
jgi:hypothetical protein